MKVLRYAPLLFLSISGCSSQEYILPANPPHAIYDSPYYRRDTLRLYQVDLPAGIFASIDTIMTNRSLNKDSYWQVTIGKKKMGKRPFSLSMANIEEMFLGFDAMEVPYKCAILKGQKVFIYDLYNLLEVDYKRPFIQMRNPRKLRVLPGTERATWHFEFNGETSKFLSVYPPVAK